MDEELLEKIRNNDPTITHVDLEGKRLGMYQYQFKKLTDVLKTNTAIIYLNLKGNAIDFHHVLLLVEALKCNKTITHVNLMRNYVGFAAVKHLLKIFKTNGILVRIDLNRTHTNYHLVSSNDIRLIEQYTQRNCNMHNNARKCIIQLLCIKKYRQYKCAYLNQIDKNIVLMIAKKVWKTRGDFDWDFIL